jgi:DNA-binding NarL/FixJ family response regulator
MIRACLSQLIAQEKDLSVCGEAESAEQALELAARTQPDLMILDLVLKDSHGLDLIRDLHERMPQTGILVVSMHDAHLHAERALRAGARGYIEKQEATRDIMHAIRTVLEGGIYLSQPMMRHLAESLSANSRPSTALAIELLTDRELQVFEMLGHGHGTRDIARHLRLDVRTIETYRARIKEKLNLKSGFELLQQAIRWTESEGIAPRVEGGPPK